MEYIFKRRHFNVPDESLLRDVAATAIKLGKESLTIHEYNTAGKYNAVTIIKRFGSWTETLNRAGLKIQKHTGPINKMDLLSNLKKVWDKLGRQPTQRQMIKPFSDYSYATYKRIFGTWYNAIEAFIKYMNENGEIVKVNKEPEPVKKTHSIIKRKELSKSLRFDILKRDKFKCRLCGRSPATHPNVVLHVDHVKPVSKDGTNDPDELQTLCSDCNIGKGAKT